MKMCFSDEVKLQAQSALKPYLEGDYPSNVKNPVLLLNYLYQHEIIPRPNYNALFTDDKFRHAVSCKIGNLEMIGHGNTNKIAKTQAAQLFLDILFNTDNDNPANNCMNTNTSQSYSNVRTGSTVPVSKIHVNDNVSVDSVCENRTQSLYYHSQMENCVSNGVSESFTLHKQNERSDGQSVIYAEPQCDQSDSHLNSQTSNNLTLDQTQLSSVTQLSCDDYFDPFFNKRPIGFTNYNYIVQPEPVENDQPEEPKPDNITTEESNINVDSKNVFSILQKKTQKHLKLIPRFRFENAENGFQCSVQLGSYNALGEGRNKREAKTNAAINLLNQMKYLD